MPIYLLITLVFLTLTYTFYLGFNDGANAVASTIATRAMKPHIAIIVAGITKFVTPLILYFFLDNLAVANTIRGILIDNTISNSSVEVTYPFISASLIATLVWSFYTYYLKVPNSGSHTIMGALVGSAIAAFGFSAIVWNTIFFKVLLFALLAPIFGLVIGYVFMKIFRKMAKTAPYAINKIMKNFQRVNVIILASSFSLNNVQKALGIFFLIMAVGNASTITGSPNDVLYLLMMSGAMLTIGMLLGGYRIINTVGNKIFKLRPYHSVVAQVSTGAIVYASSLMGVPVSTGQVVSSSIMGIGASERLSGVQWYTAKKIFISWFITFPISAILGAGTFYVISFIKGVI